MSWGGGRPYARPVSILLHINQFVCALPYFAISLANSQLWAHPA